jgi:hypothetical protein
MVKAHVPSRTADQGEQSVRVGVGDQIMMVLLHLIQHQYGMDEQGLSPLTVRHLRDGSNLIACQVAVR